MTRLGKDLDIQTVHVALEVDVCGNGPEEWEQHNDVAPEAVHPAGRTPEDIGRAALAAYAASHPDEEIGYIRAVLYPDANLSWPTRLAIVNGYDAGTVPAGHFTLQGHRVEIAAARAVFGEILAAQWEGDNSFGVNLDTEVAYIDASDSREYTVMWETLDEGANWTLYKTRGHGADAKDIIVSFARVTDRVKIANLDNPSGSPAFDGFVDEAHNALQAGIYDTTDGRRVIVNKWGSGLIGATSIELTSGVYFLLDDDDADNTFRNLGVMPGPDAYDDWTEIDAAGVGDNEEPLLAAIAAALRPGGDIAAAIAADAAFTALHNS
jgi:hypothetical protein